MQTAINGLIPQYVTVHLGKPDQTAQNYQVGFADYIKNVASSKIHPTWNENAVKANIYTYITFALDRIMTKHYRSQGYEFDVTNNTQSDLVFLPGRNIFENVSMIVDDIFNDYVVQQDRSEQSSEASVACSGRGILDLAKQGYTVEQILKNHYGGDIAITTNLSVQGVNSVYHEAMLSPTISPNELGVIQKELNSISDYYPSIPKIIKQDGNFDIQTEAAVRAFQNAFHLKQNGLIDKTTWYQIKQVNHNLKQLSDLIKEGMQLENVTRNDDIVFRKGMHSMAIKKMQYYLNMIAYFNETIPLLKMDGSFGVQTQEAVIAFQKSYGLVQDGVVGLDTWSKMENLFANLVETFPFIADITEHGTGLQSPMTILKKGMSNSDVAKLQENLVLLSKSNRQSFGLSVTGNFDDKTQQAVRAFQKKFGLHQTGCVGIITMKKIGEVTLPYKKL